jgi:hypothetical protein
MTLIEIFTIIIVHFIADFIMQDEKWALGKSKNWEDLLDHTAVYSLVWFFAVSIILTLKAETYLDVLVIFPMAAMFMVITLIAHTATDYFTSRLVSKKFAEGKYGSAIPNFGAFTMIGADQVLHYIQLFLTYYFLVK